MPADEQLSPDPTPAPVGAAPPSARRRSRLLAPVAAVVAVTAVAAVSAVLTMGDPAGGGGGAPPPLHLYGYSDHPGADEARAVAGSAPGAPAGGGVKVVGSLPDGPRRAPVHTFPSGSAPRDQVTALARALGLSGEPQRTGDRWEVRDGERTLSVSDSSGWPWTFGPGVTAVPLPAPMPVEPAPGGPPAAACHVIVNGRPACPQPPLQRQGGGGVPGGRVPEQPDSGPGIDAGIDAGTGGAGGQPNGSAASADGTATSAGSSASDADSNAASTTTLPLPPDGAVTASPAAPPARDTRPVPSEDAVRGALRPVLAALDLSDARVAVQAVPGRGMLTADPQVDRTGTAGLTTTLTVDGDLRLAFGNGWLARPSRGAEYPLATPRDVLSRTVRPGCEPCELTPVEVTGARLALLTRWDDRGRLLLVPAWRYTVRGAPSGYPGMALVAVDPRYLAPARRSVGGAEPAPGSVEPAPRQGGAATGGAGSAGSAGSAGPGAVVSAVPPIAPPTR